MAVAVQVGSGGNHELVGDWPGVDLGNQFLTHLRARAFSSATVRAYAVADTVRRREQPMDEEAKRILFGQTAASIRRR